MRAIVLLTAFLFSFLKLSLKWAKRAKQVVNKTLKYVALKMIKRTYKALWILQHPNISSVQPHKNPLEWVQTGMLKQFYK